MGSTLNLRAVDPREVLPYLGAFVFGAPACVISYNKMCGMWTDYCNKSKTSTTFMQDVGNVASSTGTVALAVVAGTLAINPKKTVELVVPTIGTGLAMGGLWLTLKHSCGNDQLRFREVVAGTTVFGFTMHELAQRRAAYRFGTD